METSRLRPHAGGTQSSTAAGSPARSVPRLLILPPRCLSPLVDTQDQQTARSLVTDVTISLCSSRLYDVIAPYSAMKLTGGSVGDVALLADYVLETDVVLNQTNLPFARLMIDIVATATGQRVFRSEVELRSGLLQTIHNRLCEVLAEKICGAIGIHELHDAHTSRDRRRIRAIVIAPSRNDRCRNGWFGLGSTQ